MLFLNSSCRNNTCGISRVYASQLYVFHYGCNKSIFTVGKSVNLCLSCLLKESVNKHGVFRAYLNCFFGITPKHLLIIHDLHSPATQDIRRANHKRITYFICNFECFFQRTRCAALRLRNPKGNHLFAEALPVLCQMYAFRCSTQNSYTVIF